MIALIFGLSLIIIAVVLNAVSTITYDSQLDDFSFGTWIVGLLLTVA